MCINIRKVTNVQCNVTVRKGTAYFVTQTAVCGSQSNRIAHKIREKSTYKSVHDILSPFLAFNERFMFFH